MNIKFYILAIAFLFSFSIVNAQQKIEYTPSDSIYIDPSVCKIQMVENYFEDDHNLYILASKVRYHTKYYFPFFFRIVPETEKLYLVKYNKNSRQLNEPEPIEVEMPFKTFDILSTNFFNDTLNLVGGFEQKSKNMYYFYCIQYDLKTKKSFSKKIFEYPSKASTYINKSNSGGFSFVAQDPKAKAMAIKYVVVDKHLDIKQESKMLKSPLIKNAEIVNFVTSYNNRLYIHVVKKGADKKMYNDLYTIDSNKIKRIELSEKKYYFYSMHFYIDDKTNELKLLSYYGKTKGVKDGMYLASIDDKQNKLVNPTYSPFADINFDEEDDSDEAKKNTKTEKKSTKQRNADHKKEVKRDKKDQNEMKKELSITWAQRSSDGYLYILAESKVLHIKTDYSSPNSSFYARIYNARTRSYYTYGPGIVYVFDKDNKFKMATKYKYKVASSVIGDVKRGLNLMAMPNNKLVYRINSDNYLLDLKNERSSDVEEIIKSRGVLGHIKGASAKKFVIQGKNAVYVLDSKNNNYFIKEANFN